MNKEKVYNHDTFIKRMMLVNPKIKILGTYINTKTPVEYICECGEKHYKSPASLIQGHKCSKYSGTNNPYKLNTNTFKEKIKSVDNNIIVIGEYINSNVPIDFVCSCGSKTKKQPAQMLLGYTKCPSCASNRLTYNSFIRKMSEINLKIIILTPYKEGYLKKSDIVTYQCECGNTHSTKAQHLLSGHKCGKCTIGKGRLKTHDEYVNDVYKVNPNIKILSEYINGENEIEFVCECGNISKTTARQLIRGSRCRVCMGNKHKTTEEFINEMKLINQNIIIIGTYVNAETPIEYVCECGNTHFSSPSLLLMGHRCGHCNMSGSEYKTTNYLNSQNVRYEYEYKFDDCVNKRCLKFDFYLPDYNICLELDGEHHFRPVRFKGIDENIAVHRHQYTKELDEIKNKYCKDKNITLIRIPYWDFDRIENTIEQYLNKKAG